MTPGVVEAQVDNVHLITSWIVAIESEKSHAAADVTAAGEMPEKPWAVCVAISPMFAAASDRPPPAALVTLATSSADSSAMVWDPDLSSSGCPRRRVTTAARLCGGQQSFSQSCAS